MKIFSVPQRAVGRCKTAAQKIFSHLRTLFLNGDCTARKERCSGVNGYEYNIGWYRV